MVEHLYIHGTEYTLLLRLQDDIEDMIEDMQLLEVFHAFTTVKNLYVSWEFAEIILRPILQEYVGERVTGVLPALESLCFDKDHRHQPSKRLREALGQFVAARQLVGHPVAISYQSWFEKMITTSVWINHPHLSIPIPTSHSFHSLFNS
jgi:hypothetical protein